MLAGRESTLDIAEERLDVLSAGGMPSQDLLFFGPRGNGKTALLIEMKQRARKRGLRVEELPVNALRREEKLVRELQERAGLRGDRLTGVQVAGVGATAARGAPTENMDRLFAAWIASGDARPSVIVVDEVHALSPDAARRSSMRSRPPRRAPRRSCCSRPGLQTHHAGSARPRPTTNADSGGSGSAGCDARTRSPRSPSRRGCPGDR